MFSRMLCLKRRFNIYLKCIAIASLAIFYFAFLFRESLHAYEATKNKLNLVKEELKHRNIPIIKHQKNYKTNNKNLILIDTIKNKYDENDDNNNIEKRFIIDDENSKNNNIQNEQYLNEILLSSAAHQSTQSPTINPVYEYSEELHSATEKDLQNRKFNLQDICIKQNLTGVYSPKPQEFFVSPGHNIVWCNIFKAASSTWMYYFNILGGYNIKYLQHTRRSPLELARKRFPRPKLNELNDALSSSISFLTVREPFERILSAYRDKLEGCHNQYYKTLGKQIIKLFRNKNHKHNNNNYYENIKKNFKLTQLQQQQLRQQEQNKLQQKQCHNNGPTFKEFLLFLINNSKNHITFDEHWTPMYSFCTPCSINYTLIAKTETFQRDSEYIIRQAGLEPLLLGKLPKKRIKTITNHSSHNTGSLIKKYFSKIDRTTLDELINIYRLDFELFGYNYTKYYDMIEQSEKPPTSSSQLPQLHNHRPFNLLGKNILASKFSSSSISASASVTSSSTTYSIMKVSFTTSNNSIATQQINNNNNEK